MDGPTQQNYKQAAAFSKASLKPPAFNFTEFVREFDRDSHTGNLPERRSIPYHVALRQEKPAAEVRNNTDRFRDAALQSGREWHREANSLNKEISEMRQQLAILRTDLDKEKDSTKKLEKQVADLQKNLNEEKQKTKALSETVQKTSEKLKEHETPDFVYGRYAELLERARRESEAKRDAADTQALEVQESEEDDWQQVEQVEKV